MADTNTINVQGSFQGALSANGRTFIGNDNSVDDDINIPVLITGLKTSASSIAPYSFVAGVNAKSNSSCSFVFNGVADETYSGTSAITGTASFNPNGGLDGFYIGEKSINGHFESLTGFVSDQLTSVNGDGYDNNILHLTGEEEVEGSKRFLASIRFGSSIGGNTVIDGDGIHVDSDGTGGIFFHHDGGDVTSTLLETESGTLTVDAGFNVSGESKFASSLNEFNGLKLGNNAQADFTDGHLYVSTPPESNSSLAANTKFVIDSISDAIQEGAVFSNDGNYTGTNTFKNIQLSSTDGMADFTNGETYVSTAPVGDSSSLAANTEFVAAATRSLSASLFNGNSNIGSGVVPIYVSQGGIRQSSLTVGSSINPIYLNGGSITAISETVGNLNTPVYLNGGNVVECLPMVTINNNANQNVIGEKTFSKLRASGNVYLRSPHGKGDAGSASGSAAVYISGSTNNPDSANSRLGMMEHSVASNGDSSIKLGVYRNETNTALCASLGISISKDGNTRYATAPLPKSGASTIYDSANVNDEVVPTIGWLNQKVRNNSSLTTPTLISPTVSGALKFTSGNASAYIEKESSDTISIIPTSTKDSSLNSATNIRLGRKQVGSNIKPIFINSDGYIREASLSLGYAYSPIYISNGEFKEIGNVLLTDNLKYNYIYSENTFFNSLSIKAGSLAQTGYGIQLFNEGYQIGSSNSAITTLAFTDKNRDLSKKMGDVQSSADANNNSSLSLRLFGNNFSKTAEMGVYSNADGSTKYAYAPTPASDVSTDSNKIATVGWCNSYLRRNNNNVFSTSLTVNAPLILSSSLVIRSEDGRHRTLIRQSSGVLNIVPEGNTVSSLKIGTAGIGAKYVPIYIENGVIKESSVIRPLIGCISLVSSSAHLQRLIFYPMDIIRGSGNMFSDDTILQIVACNNTTVNSSIYIYNDIDSDTGWVGIGSEGTFEETYNYKDYRYGKFDCRLPARVGMMMNIRIY